MIFVNYDKVLCRLHYVDNATKEAVQSGDPQSKTPDMVSYSPASRKS